MSMSDFDAFMAKFQSEPTAASMSTGPEPRGGTEDEMDLNRNIEREFSTLEPPSSSSEKRPTPSMTPLRSPTPPFPNMSPRSRNTLLATVPPETRIAAFVKAISEKAKGMLKDPSHKNKQSPERARILIVGAGVTGLVLAIELLRRGIPVRIVDRRKGPAATSVATLLYGRAMEILDHMGIVDLVKPEVHRLEGHQVHLLDKPTEVYRRADFPRDTEFTVYHKIYVLSQCVLEHVLEAHAQAMYDVKVEYASELIGVAPIGPGAVEAFLSGSKGPEYFRYVVRCDGQDSIVRNAVERRSDPTADTKPKHTVDVNFREMHVVFRNLGMDPEYMHVFPTMDWIMSLVKLPGPGWRLHVTAAREKTISFEDLDRALMKVAGELREADIHILQTFFKSRWTALQRHAERYHADGMILCGDAAFGGGLGLDLCIQSAFNLGWKLAHDHDAHTPILLDRYEHEAKGLAQWSKDTAARHRGSLRSLFLESSLEQDVPLFPTGSIIDMETRRYWSQSVVRNFSGLSYSYPPMCPPDVTPAEGLASGVRAPESQLREEPQFRVYDIFRRPQFTILVVIPDRWDAQILAYGADLRRVWNNNPWMPNPHFHVVHADRQLEWGFNTEDCTRVDEQFWGRFMEDYKIGEEGRLILVRPDLHIAMQCVPKDYAVLATWIKEYVLRPVTKVIWPIYAS